MTKTLLFIGDSITECGRFEDPEHIGNGYVKFLHDEIKSQKPDWTVLNRGVSGDKVWDLEKRWEEDVLAHDPDVLSVSIGVNDVWHQLDHPKDQQVTPDEFEQVYRKLLSQLSPSTMLVLMEPTIIEEDPLSKGNQELSVYAEIVRLLAEEHRAFYVPTYAAFMEALAKGNHAPLTTDGVHMTDAGNRLMAAVWKANVNL
ncbi:SGNH/GDSL hydrolase family protein [Jeotgalibacillus sp. ET6]|uniref:SGNH/GDSL hydrolase family protein n=1 Tax=Jeotgalibacillus sp. ET6 TaxID=3037260 RepID=UPI0024189A52|nr:SGNH/GDSL hydrolase family protein [Jeotgalibacillus sp. ET6]MDG5471536.1 SGNH/GDSL hydrolase family protein [Jeotgalibacillus sp. ET6]